MKKEAGKEKATERNEKIISGILSARDAVFSHISSFPFSFLMMVLSKKIESRTNGYHESSLWWIIQSVVHVVERGGKRR